MQFGGSPGHHHNLIAAEASEMAIAANHLDDNGDPDPDARDTAAATIYVSNKIKACFM